MVTWLFAWIGFWTKGPVVDEMNSLRDDMSFGILCFTNLHEQSLPHD